MTAPTPQPDAERVQGEVTAAVCSACDGDGATYEQVRVGQDATPFVCRACAGSGEASTITEAVKRAGEELRDLPTVLNDEDAQGAARRALAAALDVEEMARAMYEGIRATGLGMPPWESMPESRQYPYMVQATALRAAILGGAA